MQAGGIIAILLLGLGVGGYWLLDNSWDKRYQAGYEAGVKAGREECTEQVAELSKKIVAQERNARKAENDHSSEVVRVTEKLSRGKENALKREHAIIDGLRTRNLRLHKSFALCADSLSREPAAAGGGDGADGSEFPIPALRPLFREIGPDGDLCANRLTALQGWAKSLPPNCRGETP